MSVSLRGIPASAGVVIEKYLLYEPEAPSVSQEYISGEQIDQEWQRLQQALQVASSEVAQLRDQVQQRLGKEEAAIFDAHLMLLEDDALLESAHQHITDDLMQAEWAVWEAIEEFAQVLDKLENPYFQARTADIYDIRSRIINHLQARSTVQLQYLHDPVILVARDLLPSDTAGLNATLIMGIATEQGGPTSHTAILARQMGIPAVVGANGLLDAVRATEQISTRIALNGSTGEVIVAPDANAIRLYEMASVEYQEQQEQLESLKDLAAITPDGISIELAANIGRPRDAQVALEAGARGIGLFRTEFLFLDRNSPPTEEEQYEAYREVLHVFAGKTVIVRTLDIGGDKEVPYLSLPKENNPFLGLRGIRLCLAPEYQDLFRVQVRALLLAAQNVRDSLWIMFPMICDLHELRQAKAFLVETEAQLLREGKLATGVLQGVRIGIMLETPASIWLLDQLAQEADFFSLGTNDLTQYTLASDRMNARLAELHRPFHPAVMRSIAYSIRQARQHDRWIGMCGEMAGDPRACAFLLGLGINELSMDPRQFNAVKKIIRNTTQQQALQLVEEVLAAESAEAIEKLLS